MGPTVGQFGCLSATEDLYHFKVRQVRIHFTILEVEDKYGFIPDWIRHCKLWQLQSFPNKAFSLPFLFGLPVCLCFLSVLVPNCKPLPLQGVQSQNLHRCKTLPEVNPPSKTDPLFFPASMRCKVFLLLEQN